MKKPIQHFWLHAGCVQDAIAWKDRIQATHDVGYVYVLALSNGTTKLGSTSYFPTRLGAHQRDFRRSGILIDRCTVTRPAFNYREVELAAKRHFESEQYFGEVFLAPINEISNFIRQMRLSFVAPDSYGRSHQCSHAFLTTFMAEINDRLGIKAPEGMQRYVQGIINRHTALGRETGLSERDSMLNALAVIEAHTGLKLDTFRNVLAEVE